jgi:hypothetical protein
VTSADPTDVRLLSLLADLGRAALPDIAARLGMDPREVAARLLGLSAAGLPLVVGVECDPHRLRGVLASMGGWSGYPRTGVSGPPSGGHPAPPMPPAPVVPGAWSGGVPAPAPAAMPQRPAPGVDPISTWGPPQTSSWARGDQGARPNSAQQQAPQAVQQSAQQAPPQQQQQPQSEPQPAETRRGRVGDTLRVTVPTGHRLSIRLVELVDPADVLFNAAGYRLREGERSAVVHTELTNEGGEQFGMLPDLYLALVTAAGEAIRKAPVSLSSRPPHRMGVRPGGTADGNTVFVLPDNARITAVRWAAGPEAEDHELTWDLT